MKKILLLFAVFFVSYLASAENNPLWMRYPSISPDGKFIAFSYKGDIFKVSSSGGTAIALTTHKAHEYKPVWAPDGKSIAFASDRHGNFDIFVVPVTGGNAKRLTFYSSNESPSSFTPDGRFVLFSSTINDVPQNTMFPRRNLSELYKVSTSGGRTIQVLSTPAIDARYNKSGNKLLYRDVKGLENHWRKHHTSSVTRDIWIYDTKSKKHTKLTTFKGEDLYPAFSKDENEVYYISEQYGSNANICKIALSNPAKVEQVTKYKNHPVRFLSTANDGTLCYGYDGEIYTKSVSGSAKKVKISIFIDDRENLTQVKKLSKRISDMAVSPDAKEIAFIIHGEVYVTSVDYSTTKRITNTPEQERSVSFSPNGKSLLYAGERNGSWNLYQTKIVKKDEKHFANATTLKEETLLKISEETFQPQYSPDGKEVAFLKERDELWVLNLKSKKTRLIVNNKRSYSYADGDQWYEWSPDSKWFLVDYYPNQIFVNDVGLISADGKQKIKNLTQSGYSDGLARWMMGGKVIMWFSDRNGYRSHGSWGSHGDVYAMFLTQKTLNKFNLSKEEVALLKAKKKKDKKKDKDKKDKKVKTKDVVFEFDGLEDRYKRMTINSSNISDAIMTPDGEKLYYLSRFEKGFDLWVHEFRKNKTKLVSKLRGGGGAMQFDKKGKNLFLYSGGSILKISVGSHKKKTISFSAELNWNNLAEKAYMYEHVWRQMKKKFYNPNLHGVKWDFYKKEYAKFLPFITNNYDYADLLSELLGEINASHTGSGYRHSDPNGDKTAKLGAFYDLSYKGDGLKIVELMDKSPLLGANKKITKGMIIEKVDGQLIKAKQDYFKYFNNKAGKKVLFTIYDPATKNRWDEIIKPISIRSESNLLYKRWVKQRRIETEKVSKGRLGYIHVRGMNSASYRHVFKELLGRYFNKEAIVIDTRFNGGGWLHDDLATLLNGKRYVDFYPRGREMGFEPMQKWTKPSVVLMNEGNYSDAHAFPFTYSTLKIGKTVGMPVPGTMTAVWWETLIDRSLYFGIPMVGAKTMEGKYLENNQLEPDYKVVNKYEIVIKGRDQQLEKAVDVLLKQLDKK